MASNLPDRAWLVSCCSADDLSGNHRQTYLNTLNKQTAGSNMKSSTPQLGQLKQELSDRGENQQQQAGNSGRVCSGMRSQKTQTAEPKVQLTNLQLKFGRVCQQLKAEGHEFQQQLQAVEAVRQTEAGQRAVEITHLEGQLQASQAANRELEVTFSWAASRD